MALPQKWWNMEAGVSPLRASRSLSSDVTHWIGLFGAALQYHLHYMVLAFAVYIINITETALNTVIFNYVNECFTSHAQEVTAALNFYRLILGLVVTFYIDPWVASVGPG